MADGRSRAAGYLAAVCFVGIWGAWVVWTRHAVTHSLEPAAVGLLRFGVAAILLFPFAWRVRFGARHGLLPLAIMVIGSGAPFFIVVANGMRSSPAADAASLVPGTMPLVVALLSAAFFKERMGWPRWLGFACVAVGIAAIGGRDLFIPGGATLGHAMLLTGACVWATYTLAFRRSGLSAIEAAALVGFWSTMMLLPFGALPLVNAVRAGLGHDVAVQTLVQGLLSGVIAVIAYNFAIGRLGASRAAAFVALVPALAALIAIPVLGEWPDLASTIGVVATGLGVALASGALESRQPKAA
ncbi:MAG TPA: DMT family transporter [Xanthobacteraceae bacterium]|nr:DMT family transporter [Xanthobacteraceae bacterium]